MYSLIYTNRKSEDRATGESAAESTSPSRWLISDPNDTLMLTVRTATRYVTEARDKSKDPVLKKNADETLAKLAKLR